MAPQVFVNTRAGVHDIFHQDGFVQKQIPPKINTDDIDFKFKRVLLNFFDPCKSVLSVSSAVRFGVFGKADED